MTFTEATLTEKGRQGDQQAVPRIDDQLLDVLACFPAVVLAVLFGSVALGACRTWGSQGEKVGERGQILTNSRRIAGPIQREVGEIWAAVPLLQPTHPKSDRLLGRQRFDSDLDIAVEADTALTAVEKMAIIEALAERTGRPIDLVDLKVVAEPLLGQIVRHGRRLLGSDSAYGQLISRHLLEQADFMPYCSRVLAERRAAWIAK